MSDLDRLRSAFDSAGLLFAMVSEQSTWRTYSPEQIDAYLSHISFPVKKYGRITPEIARSKDGLQYLAVLQKYQLSSIPFENLSLHYSPDKSISVQAEVIFEKIVGSGRARGGYCMENNCLFATVLRTLGFDVVTIGARVGTLGWCHQVSLVCFENILYMVDVGFGGPGPTKPLPLIDGLVSTWGATAAEVRLVYQAHSNPLIQGTWVYEHRISHLDSWEAKYTFITTEFTTNDFEVMSYHVSRKQTSWFTYRILVLKMILDEELDEITGLVILSGNKLKKRVYADSERLAEFTTEDERVAALKKHFGVVLTPIEIESIKGLVTELGNDNY